jgi:outer membrane protein TolC
MSSLTRSCTLVLVLALVAVVTVAQPEPPELGVDAAVAAALANQPRLKAAESQLDAARARTRETQLKRLGELTTTLLYTPEQKPLKIDFAGFPPYVPPLSFDVKQIETYSAMASYTLPLWTGGALGSERRAAQSAERAGEAALSRARQRTALEAAQAFHQGAAVAAAVGVAEQNLEQQQVFLRATELRAQAGAAARLDQLKAQLAVSRAESDLIEARHRERLAREALVTVTGDERFRSARLKPQAEGILVLPEESAAVERARRQRPDLRSLERQIEAQRFAGNALSSARLPALAFRAQLTQQNAALGDVLGSDSQMYSLGFALNWDVTKALRGGAAVAEQRAAESGLRHTLRAAENEAELEVRAALFAAREARERVQVQQQGLAAAEEQARVARLAYREGVITSVEAQDAELGLTGARFGLLRARFDAATADAALKCALGE